MSELPVISLHGEIDRATEPLVARHAARLQCRRGCADCCVDGLTVFEVEAARIRRAFGELLADGEPHAPGACAFLDANGACRIYEARPYVCRTQGLPLRWIEFDPPVEYRDICPLNESAEEPIEALPAADCWELGPYEGRLAALQPDGARVALRELFGRC